MVSDFGEAECCAMTERKKRKALSRGFASVPVFSFFGLTFFGF